MRAGIMVIGLAAVSGCYSGARTTRDSNAAWRGHSLSALESEWGKPAKVEEAGQGLVAIWSHAYNHVVALPSFAASFRLDEHGLDAYAEAHPGEMQQRKTEVFALVDASGIIRQVDGPSLRWGPPNEANIHWGLLFGVYAGMGRLDDTSTPLPSGGAYIGGMLSRRLGLVGTFELASGSDDAGGAMGLAWGLAPQWWLTTRLSLRAGPAMIVAFDPGFENGGLEPGVDASASYALLKSGTFALDLRFDMVAGTSTSFGSVGVGVNVN